MRTKNIVSVALAAASVPLVWAATVTLPAIAETGTPAAAPQAAAGRAAVSWWQCRTTTAAVTPSLTSTGTVCGRLDGATWRGRATVTLAAHGSAVQGTVSLGPDHLPTLAETHVTNRTFRVAAGRSVTVVLDGATPVTAADTGVVWQAQPSVSPAPGSGLEWGSRLASPVIPRGARVVDSRTDAAVTPWACRTSALDGVQASGRAVLCVRRNHGWAESRGTLTYTTALDGELRTGIAIDGRPAVEAVPILAAGRATTITLPVTRARLLTRDDTATATLSIVTNGSRPLTTTAASEQIAVG